METRVKVKEESPLIDKLIEVLKGQTVEMSEKLLYAAKNKILNTTKVSG